MTLFKNKYRIESTRLRGWRYDDVGCYYVTICTHRRAHYFGRVVQGDMQLSAIGDIVAQEWVRTEELRANVALDEWIIMPNHLHLIFHLTHRVGGKRGYWPRNEGVNRQASLKWVPQSMGSIIGQFKGACTKHIRKSIDPDFAWQAGFYERIIQTETALNRARYYIQQNPHNWHKDRNNDAGLYM